MMMAVNDMAASNSMPWKIWSPISSFTLDGNVRALQCPYSKSPGLRPTYHTTSSRGW